MNLAPNPRRTPRLAIVALACALSTAVAACAHTERHYERTGMAGAGIVLGGFAINMIGHTTIPPSNEQGLRATTTTGITLQVLGFLMCIYALDGLITTTGEP